MKAIIFGEARRNLCATMIQAAEDKAPVMIIRRNGESCVLMSTEEYNSLEETAWLLRSPRNARRLMDAIESLRSGDGTGRNVIA
ncbi:YoeB-YefM toxin-antitoxin system antitoxin YefM [Pantoea vagans]|uniref:YoeB-YefM toxin-antitoxin system antitoxin YefM n=1 Tax=Pantoea vagans TaxID=470934 RepID=UPI00289ED166|nr:YoeB-YefM toxin-antitoxin system antitoxin YefM [Pantoea vagans]